jgi:hypothetical protein
LESIRKQLIDYFLTSEGVPNPPVKLDVAVQSQTVAPVERIQRTHNSFDSLAGTRSRSQSTVVRDAGTSLPNLTEAADLSRSPRRRSSLKSPDHNESPPHSRSGSISPSDSEKALAQSSVDATSLTALEKETIRLFSLEARLKQATTIGLLEEIRDELQRSLETGEPVDIPSLLEMTQPALQVSHELTGIIDSASYQVTETEDDSENKTLSAVAKALRQPEFDRFIRHTVREKKIEDQFARITSWFKGFGIESTQLDKALPRTMIYETTQVRVFEAGGTLVKELSCIDKTGIEELTREVAFLHALNHRNIVKLKGYELELNGPNGLNSVMRIFQEYCPKGNLGDQIKRKRFSDYHQMINAWFGIAQALKYIHKFGIVHRDLKSYNVVIAENGEGKLCDFGVSGLRQKEVLLKTSLFWRAPEQFLGTDTIESDIFSFAMLMYEVLSGDRPFAGTEWANKVEEAILKKIRPPIPKDADKNLVDLMVNCWDQDPQKRPKLDALIARLSLLRAIGPSGKTAQ